MNRSILRVGVVAAMLLTTSSAFAAGLNLRWNTCLVDGGLQNRTSACSANTGSNVAVASFVVPNDVLAATGIENVVDVVVNESTLPAWWSRTCRTSSPITANPVLPIAALNCFDWAGGVAGGGLGAYYETTPPNGNNYGPNTARAVAVFAVTQAQAQDILAGPGTEYFAFNLVISNSKTTGTGSCAGCSASACLVFNSIKVMGSNGTLLFLEGGNTAGSNIATWQGTAANCFAVPTRNSSWGAVKSLYH